MGKCLLCYDWGRFSRWMLSKLKRVGAKKTIIRYSVEYLYHFRCEKCRGWWSIGDWQATRELHCPYCGSKGTTTPIGDTKC